jgi:hypothetical protein
VAPRHSPENVALRIAHTLAITHHGHSPDEIAMELRRRLGDAGLKPIGDEFIQLVRTVADGPNAQSPDHA